MREVRRKKRMWATAKLGEKKEEYAKQERKVKNMIRNAKKRMERRLVEEGGEKGNKEKEGKKS